MIESVTYAWLSVRHTILTCTYSSARQTVYSRASWASHVIYMQFALTAQLAKCSHWGNLCRYIEYVYGDTTAFNCHAIYSTPSIKTPIYSYIRYICIGVDLWYLGGGVGGGWGGGGGRGGGMYYFTPVSIWAQIMVKYNLIKLCT